MLNKDKDSFIDKFNKGSKITSSLSINGYIGLLNQFIELDNEINQFRKKYNTYGQEFGQVSKVISDLMRDNIETPEKLILRYQSLKSDMSNVIRSIRTYEKILEDISIITSVKNLRYTVYNIYEKSKNSLAQLSNEIGIPTEVFTTLFNKGYIDSSVLEKFLKYYNLNMYFGWNRYLLKNEV